MLELQQHALNVGETYHDVGYTHRHAHIDMRWLRLTHLGNKIEENGQRHFLHHTQGPRALRTQHPHYRVTDPCPYTKNQKSLSVELQIVYQHTKTHLHTHKDVIQIDRG